MKYKEIEKLGKSDREKKLKELKLELVKSKANAQKSSVSKAKQIKKIIARIHTLNRTELNQEKLKK